MRGSDHGRKRAGLAYSTAREGRRRLKIGWRISATTNIARPAKKPERKIFFIKVKE